MTTTSSEGEESLTSSHQTDHSSSAAGDHPLLEMHAISKAFGGVQALADVNLAVSSHSVHAVIGENGAGKSTLMKILSGALQPDSGEILFHGSAVSIGSPRDSTELGVQTVYQEPAPYLELSVLENIYTGREIRSKLGGIKWAEERKSAVDTLGMVGLPASLLDKPMRQLPIGVQQLVLIARAVAREPQILILDEPTSMLSQAETDILFQLIQELQQTGASVVYISHRIEEVFRISDRITVLRDGSEEGSLYASEATEDHLIEMMSGRHIERGLYQAPEQVGEVLLEVRNLKRTGQFRDVSFELRRGEILGMYGIVGAGRSEVAQAIFGAQPPDGGEIYLEGEEIAPSSPEEAIRMNIAYLAEDRRSQGLFPSMSVAKNLTSAIMRELISRLGRILPRQELSVSDRIIQSLKIRTPDSRTPINNLSGGSQQKVMFGRWLLAEPQVLLLDEPTRGVDVGTKAEMHRLIVDRARQENDAVLLISSELTEILAISDRVVVMREGTVQGIFSQEEATEQRILTMAIGSEGEDVA